MQCHAYSEDHTGEKPPTKIRLFNSLLKQFTFVQITVDAGNAFLRKLTLKIGSIVEAMPEKQRDKLLKQIAKELAESGERAEARRRRRSSCTTARAAGCCSSRAATRRSSSRRRRWAPSSTRATNGGRPHLTACDGDIGGRSFADRGAARTTTQPTTSRRAANTSASRRRRW